MAKVKPNIDVPHNGIAGAHSLVNSVINDFFVYKHGVDSILLNGNLSVSYTHLTLPTKA